MKGEMELLFYDHVHMHISGEIKSAAALPIMATLQRSGDA
ncbi:hypothetical protein GJA_3306 [Janthinobacterium agaricidamnosum NBRC 102515 = DSM 9628]|uniref:Uncharacterized protein n=1 Tax=Janthinobacterium agaricidamnosum NBRC 102515 = DSM 9628 TaxID=1349767 RepID=W0V8L4_9BURK|nr:hypothetical protein GJA_3306 [Janthinobacterium agaricidamnosum NBRC 102515 = DSM 9628]